MNTYIREYKRELDNKTITLIGVSHVGTEKYYHKIQQELDKHHPNILFEGVKGTELSLKSLGKFYTRFADLLDFKTQRSFIKYSGSWIHADLDYNITTSAHGEDYLKKINISDKSLSNFDKDIDKLKEEVSKETVDKILKIIFKTLFFFALLFKRRKKNPVICDLRNYKVILTIFKELQVKDNLAVFYGDAHSKGIGKYLKSVGFKQVNKYKLKPFK